MNIKTMKFLSHVIFFGALWGILEATLGFALHLIPVPFIAGSVMFPIGAAVLVTSYRRLPSRRAMLMVAIIAAAIKSVNLLTPVPTFSVTNPMASIILQSLVVIGAVGMLNKKTLPSLAGGFVLASIGWRAAYMLWHQALIASPIEFFSPHLATMQAFATFTLIEGLISAVVGVLIFILINKIAAPSLREMRLHPSLAPLALTLALVVSYFI